MEVTFDIVVAMFALLGFLAMLVLVVWAAVLLGFVRVSKNFVSYLERFTELDHRIDWKVGGNE